MEPRGWFSIDSPWAGGIEGAARGPVGTPIAIVRVNASEKEVDGIVAALGWSPVAQGAVGVRMTTRGDEVVVARPSSSCALLMPVGSPVIVDGLARELEAIGCRCREASDPREGFPEAASLVEACVLDALARCASPMGIDVLLRQRAMWARVPPVPVAPTPNPLDHLLAPPRVVVVGRPNIGKSSLLNAMARRLVAIASDEPGTTRDHVGAEVECDGLIVRWIDTPGIAPPGASLGSGIDRMAGERVGALIASADLFVLGADASSGMVERGEMPGIDPRTPVVRIGLRGDLGVPGGVDVATSARTGMGLADLGRAIRRALVPDSVIDEPVRWRFHPFLAGD